MMLLNVKYTIRLKMAPGLFCTTFWSFLVFKNVTPISIPITCKVFGVEMMLISTASLSIEIRTLRLVHDCNAIKYSNNFSYYRLHYPCFRMSWTPNNCLQTPFQILLNLHHYRGLYFPLLQPFNISTRFGSPGRVYSLQHLFMRVGVCIMLCYCLE